MSTPGLPRRLFTPLRHTGIALACASVLGAAAPAFAQPAPGEARAEKVVSGRILVMPRAGLSEDALGRTLQQNGAGRSQRVGNSNLRIVEVPAGAERATVDRLSRSELIKFAEVDRWVAPNLVTNDPYFGSAWHLPKIGAPTAWDSSLGTGITIAILDTGVDSTHPDLAALIVPGWNIYNNNSNTADVYGHGTKVAGAAAAAANNATGVAGVAGAARIMPIRISSESGSASLSAMAQGVTWAADHGARVANISYVSADSSAVRSAGDYMKSKGGLVTTSAGNYGTDAGISATTSVIPVSATDKNDVLTSWSSYGNFVAVSAPGSGIYTTTNGGGYGAVSGTSFSSPVTAGVIALMMAARPTLSSKTIESLLFSTATDLGAAGRDPYYGYGRVDAAKAVSAALAATSSTTTDTTPPTVAVTTPGTGSTVSGVVAIDVSASDNVGVTKVELLVNNGVLASDTSSPYAFAWDTNKAANGTYTLVARAYDGAGNKADSASVTISVSNVVVADTSPPSVTISNPADGSKVTGTVEITVTAADNSGTSGLKQTLTIDGKTVTSATGGTLKYKWNTRKYASGSHRVDATAADPAGNVSRASVTVSK